MACRACEPPNVPPPRLARSWPNHCNSRLTCHTLSAYVQNKPDVGHAGHQATAACSTTHPRGTTTCTFGLAPFPRAHPFDTSPAHMHFCHFSPARPCNPRFDSSNASFSPRSSSLLRTASPICPCNSPHGLICLVRLPHRWLSRLRVVHRKKHRRYKPSPTSPTSHPSVSVLSVLPSIDHRTSERAQAAQPPRLRFSIQPDILTQLPHVATCDDSSTAVAPLCMKQHNPVQTRRPCARLAPPARVSPFLRTRTGQRTRDLRAPNTASTRCWHPL